MNKQKRILVITVKGKEENIAAAANNIRNVINNKKELQKDFWTFVFPDATDYISMDVKCIDRPEDIKTILVDITMKIDYLEKLKKDLLKLKN